MSILSALLSGTFVVLAVVGYTRLGRDILQHLKQRTDP